MRDALAVRVLGEIDTLLDKVDAINDIVNTSAAHMQDTINKLEEAGDRYNQAVLAANLKSKTEMIEYVKTVTSAVATSTVDEQREIIRTMVREVLNDEIVALKQNFKEQNFKPVGKYSILLNTLITALITSAAMVAMWKIIG